MPGPYFNQIAPGNDLQFSEVYVVDVQLAQSDPNLSGYPTEFTLILASRARDLSPLDDPAIAAAAAKAMADGMAAYDWAALTVATGYSFTSATVSTVTEADTVIYATPAP